MATIAYCVCAARWILATPQPGWATVLLALPPIVGEVAFTRAFEVSARGWRRGVLFGLAGRLLFAGLLAYLYIWLPLRLKGSEYLWFAQDLSASHFFLRIVWLSSPLPALVLALVCLAAYAGWTVRSRRCRLTTTVLLPGLATGVLFLLMYQFPNAAIRHVSRTRPDFVVHVWTSTSPDHRFPREVMVTADEQHAVATFGSTFPFDRSNPPPDELDLGRRCNPKGRDTVECRRNLALIDLKTGVTRTWSMPMTRRFFSETGDRFFVVPWNISSLLELMLDGSIRKYPLPEWIGDGPLREINQTYYAADTGLVYMVSNNNPVLLAWNVQTGRIEHARPLAGSNGIDIGDSAIALARSRSRHRLYVMVKSDPHVIVELDETGLTPLRSIRPAPDVYDIEISPDETSLYMTSFFSGYIWRFGADTLKLEATLDAPLQCRRIAFSPDGTQLFAASYLTGELVVYDTRTNQKADSFYVAQRLEGMHVAGGGLYLLSAEGLYRVSLEVLKKRAERASG